MLAIQTRRPRRGLWLSAISLTLLTIFTLSSHTAVKAERAADLKPLGYVVVLNPGRNAGAQAQKLARAHNASHTYNSVFQGFSASLTRQAVKALKQNPNVLSVEIDFSVELVGEVLPDGVDRIDAENAHTSGEFGTGANVAVIDTGIDLDHPDLAGNVNLTLSRTFVSRGNTTSGGDDDHGHGSHVAGTIAAVAGNGIGVIGVAPGATLIALKVLDKRGKGRSSDIIAALDFITGHNNGAPTYLDAIHVANCSFGGGGGDSNSAYRRAFEACVASGCFIAVAAGNESDDAANHVPAAYDSVFTVSAMNPLSGDFASFSNFGSDIDIAAPGTGIYSTYKNGGYATGDGTSMASPHVAGAAALYIGQNKASMTLAAAESEIRTALIGTGEIVALPGDTDGIAEPLVDAEALLGPIAPPTPTVNVSIQLDQQSYSDTDTVAVLTVTPRDEYGVPIAGLTSGQVVTTGAPVLSFAEVAAGVYDVEIDISGFTPDLDYYVTETVTDNRPLSGDATVTIQRSSAPAAATIYVSGIGYRQQGPHLFIDIYISSTTPGADVSSVNVDITLNLDGTPLASASGSTGADGKVSFRLRNAPGGSYTTTIDGVSKDGMVYNSSLNAADPGHTK